MKTIAKKLYPKRNAKGLVFFDKLFYRIGDHDTFAYGGSLTYYLVLAIFPFLIALINAVNFSGLLSPSVVLEYLSFLPADIQKIVVNFLKELSNSSSGGLLSISVLVGLFSASSGINKIIQSINRAYGFKDKRNFVIVRGLALVFTIAMIVMFILLSLTQIFGQIIYDAIMNYLHLHNPNLDRLWGWVKTLLPPLYMLLTFILLYRFSPGSPQKKMISLRSVIPGALFTTLAVILATAGFGFYVNNFGKYSVTYGSLGGIIVFLIWLYIMSAIILIGGEINATLFSMKHFESLSLWPRHDSVLKNILPPKA